MEVSRICKNCKERTIIFDDASSTYVCSSCGMQHQSDIYRSDFEGTFNAHPGNIVGISSSEYSYKDRKGYHAKNQIKDMASYLDLSTRRSDDIFEMIKKVTDGEFGSGDWFLVLIIACAYIVMRQNYIPVSISEICALTGSDMTEVGRMVTRVTEFLGQKLPEFDAMASFERFTRNTNCLSKVPSSKLDRMLKQGRFLLQCSVKWFLMTGRQPMPVIAAVLLFVAEVNLVEVQLEDIAKELYASVLTTKKRYKELNNTLIKVAQALPWGKDVTEKNLVKNFPLIFRYMEMKLKQDNKALQLEPNESIQFDLQEIARNSVGEIRSVDDCSTENHPQYFNMGDKNRMVGSVDLETLKLSNDCSWKSYMECIDKSSSVLSSSHEFLKESKKERKREAMPRQREYLWMDCSNSNKNLPLDLVLEKNVGFDALPPSFVSGMDARKRRRQKINSAKQRINEIKPLVAGGFGGEKVVCSSEDTDANKERKRARENASIDSEDCIVELLLLHGADEEQIEQGHYKTLLDLHIFDSVSGNRFPFLGRT